MYQERLWQGLKKSVIGLYFLIEAAGDFITEYLSIDIPGTRLYVSPYLILLILLSAYIHIGNVYKEKLSNQARLFLTRQQKLLTALGTFLAVTAGIVFNLLFETSVWGIPLFLALFIVTLWFYWDRKSWFAILFAAALAFVAFLPLFVSDSSLESILIWAIIGIAFVGGGIYEHRALTQEAAIFSPSAAPKG
jgi:hypothetical protein